MVISMGQNNSEGISSHWSLEFDDSLQTEWIVWKLASFEPLATLEIVEGLATILGKLELDIIDVSPVLELISSFHESQCADIIEPLSWHSNLPPLVI